MATRNFYYNDKGGLQVHGWLFETFRNIPDFSYNNYEIEIYMKFKDVEEYIQLFDSEFQRTLNQNFGIINIEFYREDDTVKLQLVKKLSKEIQ